MKLTPHNHTPRPIGSNTPSRRRSDKRWADTQPEHPACGATPAWFGIDPAAPGSEKTVIALCSAHHDEYTEQQQGDSMGSFIVTALGLVGALGLLALCWWAGHGGKWVSPW